MPQLAAFYGIVIYMYHKPREHNPPHIHASYGEHNATLIIENGDILEGELPNRALRLVREWMEIHRPELAEMWETGKIGKIKPLE